MVRAKLLSHHLLRYEDPRWAADRQLEIGPKSHKEGTNGL